MVNPLDRFGPKYCLLDLFSFSLSSDGEIDKISICASRFLFACFGFFGGREGVDNDLNQ